MKFRSNLEPLYLNLVEMLNIPSAGGKKENFSSRYLADRGPRNAKEERCKDKKQKEKQGKKGERGEGRAQTRGEREA